MFALYDQCRYMQDSDGGRKYRTCVCCMQGVCGGFGTRRPSNQEAFGKRPRGVRSVFYYFDDSFTSTRCLYLSPSQLCLIKRICTSYARARTHTCPEAGRRATPARPRAPKPSRRNDQRPRSRPPRPGAAPSPRRALHSMISTHVYYFHIACRCP